MSNRTLPERRAFLPGWEGNTGPTPSCCGSSVSLPVFRGLEAGGAFVLTSQGLSFVIGWEWGKVWPPDVWDGVGKKI